MIVDSKWKVKLLHSLKQTFFLSLHFFFSFFAYVIYKRSLVLPNFYGDKVRSKFSAAEFLIALKS